uniref:Uncharacterized protein n=1 Tax=Glossina brevipalpis TaxID=37001 RepID=A0A1A9X166_9MUSC
MINDFTIHYSIIVLVNDKSSGYPRFDLGRLCMCMTAFGLVFASIRSSVACAVSAFRFQRNLMLANLEKLRASVLLLIIGIRHLILGLNMISLCSICGIRTLFTSVI